MTRKKAEHDLAGRRFGRLVAMEYLGTLNGSGRWLCQCDCGVQPIVKTHRLVIGTTSSCGCLRRERMTTHGRSRTRTHRIWNGLVQRATNSNRAGAENYALRGIGVCNRWRESFENFVADMGECPDGMSIDRINNDGDYEPSNCRWATRATQNQNRRDNQYLTIDGRTECVAVWSREGGVRHQTIRQRVRLGWEPRRAVFEKPKKVLALVNDKFIK